jgi:poly(hydroxyalkanoate) granule-associated protein
MLKKAKTESETASGGQRKDIADKIMKSSRHIWLAGLGAFAKAQQEGSKVFESLVKQGEELEQKTKQAATKTASAARGAAMSKAKEMQQMAGGTWDKLEQVFEDRVARALSKLGVYTQNDVQRLAERVDQLAEAVNKLMKHDGGRRKAPAAKSAQRSSAKRPKAAKDGQP